MNRRHDTPLRFDTADFADVPPYGPGNLRVDYCCRRSHCGIPSSDHRLVRVQLRVPGAH